MRNMLAYLLPLSMLFSLNSVSFARVNPIDVIYNSGSTTFTTSSSGTANYVVSVNQAVVPNNVSLELHLDPSGASSGLAFTQITAGSSTCTGVNNLCASTFSLRAGESCCLALSLTSSTPGNYNLQPKVSTSPATYSAQAPSGLQISVLKNTTPMLSVSKNELALSVTGLTLNGLPSGQPRQFEISNTGDVAVTGINISEPTWPTNTAMTSSCTDILPAGQSCSITITPGSQSTSNCTSGIAPTPSVITLSADGIPPINMSVVILGYGCIYQDGYIFSMIETPLATSSIGGSVAAQNDALTTPVWGSNGHGPTSADVSYDLIPGISDTSSSSNGVPSFADFATYFGIVYSTQLQLTPQDFNQCNAKSSGGCNTANIVKFYTYYNTNYGVGSFPYTPTVASTPTSDYAAGLCYAYHSESYQDWYLPAACELSVDNPSRYPGRELAGCGTADAPLMQNIEQNLAINGIGGFQYHGYWSSTQTSPYDPTTYAWNALLCPDIDFTYIGGGDKSDDSTFTRCVRALTV